MVKDLWNLKGNDKIPIESLYDMEKFFQNDLMRAQDHAIEILKFKMYKLPNYYDMIQKAIDEISESLDNLKIVQFKIKQMEEDIIEKYR